MKKWFLFPRISVLLVSALAMTFLFSACNKSNDNNSADLPASGLMAFNLATDVSQATIALSGSGLTAAPLGYTNYTGGYLGIYSGQKSVQSFNYATGLTLATSTFNFEQDKYYSLFIAGANNTYRNIIVTDNLDSLSTSGNEAFVRYVNAIPDSSHPTVTVTANGSNIVNSSAAFASVSDFVAVSAGDINIQVSNGGTINASRTITLEQRKIYTILLTGVPGGTAGNEVQIKYILNGTVDASTGRSASASGRSAN